MNHTEMIDESAGAAGSAATEKAAAKKGHSTGKSGNSARRSKAVGTSKAKVAKKAGKAKSATTPLPAGESKGAKILALIARGKGASLAELMKVTDWQAHSVRGFLSSAKKKHRIKIDSAKSESGSRIYRITK